MKHNIKITIILLIMFLTTQLIGLFIVKVYTDGVNLPYGMEPPAEVQQETSIASILLAFVIAISLFFILTKLNAERFIRLWFFIVTALAIGLALNAIFFKINLIYASIIAIIISIPLAYIKIFKRNIIVHNITELLIYPGIASVFIPIVNVFGIIVLLLAISLYDIWAVWHSEFMQKIAHYQINNLRFFTGFFIPYADKKQKLKIKQIKNRYASKSEEIIEKHLKKAKIKIQLAILGGGDIVFPIITSGVFYKTYHSLIPAIIILIAATISLLLLFILARRGKFYPAMPFLTIGMYLAMILSWILMKSNII